jgi:hypothetical protein
MTNHRTSEQGTTREHRGEQTPSTPSRHSLAAAAVCVGTGATIGLVSILVHLW